jgi:RNA polymerase sigma factor (sigma-70 family)
MKNTPFEDTATRQQQVQRVQNIIRNALTPLQRETLMAFYFREQSISSIARERNVHRSTVARTLRRAEKRLKTYLKF